MKLQQAVEVVRGVQERGIAGNSLHSVSRALAVLRANSTVDDAAYWAGWLLYRHHLELDVPDESRMLLTQAIRQDPADVDARFLLGCAEFDAGNWSAARQLLIHVATDSRLPGEFHQWQLNKCHELIAVCAVRLGLGCALEEVGRAVQAMEDADDVDFAPPVELAALVDAVDIPGGLAVRIHRLRDR